MSSCLLPNCTHQPSDTPLKLDPRKAAGRVLQNMHSSICFIEVIRGSWGTKVLLIVNSWDCINISISIAYLQKFSNHRCARFLRKQQRILNFLYFSIGCSQKEVNTKEDQEEKLKYLPLVWLKYWTYPDWLEVQRRVMDPVTPRRLRGPGAWHVS